MTPMSASAEGLLARAAASFEAGAPALDAIAKDFQAQIAQGLAGEGGSLKMLRTFTRQPSGRERGRVVVVDWGGTNARAGLVELAGGGAARIVTEETLRVPGAHEARGAGAGLRPHRGRGRPRGPCPGSERRPARLRLLLPGAARGYRPGGGAGLDQGLGACRAWSGGTWPRCSPPRSGARASRGSRSRRWPTTRWPR